MSLDSLLDILKKAQTKNPLFSARLAEAEALGRWEIAVGKGIAKHARAVRVKDSILWVEVEHPIWRAELQYRKNQILEILNGQVSPNDRNPQGSEGKNKPDSQIQEKPCRISLPQPRQMITDIQYMSSAYRRSQS